MKITPTPLNGLLVIEPRCFQDERGFFLETYQEARYREAGITDEFVQDNQSRSIKGVLRGMHFQVQRPQAQIVTVMRGRIFDVGVDLRPTSPTFGQWYGVELSDSGPRQIYMAPGFAHGFCVLSDWADLHYKVSCNYDAHDEGGLLWNDPDVGIQWPLTHPTVTRRDANYPQIKNLSFGQLPHEPPILGK
ncbi:MAG: dTDP-4-dehydrorhamnose 3,5-epimerase [Planctomycetes bacterium GWC2_49_10]|nr:MAG: dTDP-4-dehydrorhamnose 3,5-epimerase [Planctomycetes bacterium GWC2_49_10]